MKDTSACAPPRRRRRGVTLLELMCVLAVLAVLGTLAVPSLNASAQRHRLLATAQRLAADLAEARFEAARQGAALHLLPRSGPGWCWSVSPQPGCDCQQAPACATHVVHARDHPGVQLLQAQAAVLLPQGTAGPSLPATGPVAQLLGRGGERLQVQLSPLGRPRICAVDGVLPGVPAC
jgi:type IV fimbrial biogenesis protein FimT